MGVKMIGKILEIANNNRFLSLKRGCMNISDSKTKQSIADIPLDDIDGIILSGHGLWHSTNLLAKLAHLGITVVIIDSHYKPIAIVIGISNNTLQGQRIIAQHDANLSMNKRLWQEIVQTKLLFQTSLLAYHKSDKTNQVKLLIKNVKSGDPSNLEAQGARYYWQGLMQKIYPDFKREQDSNDSINIALNYGYTILRTAVAKNILAAGLHAGWGIHHCHPNNTMPLADDLMEPFRAFVDAKVYALSKGGYLNDNDTINNIAKKSLADVIYTDILILGETKPLINYLQTLAQSLVRIYMNEGKILAFPEVKKIHWEDFEEIHRNEKS